MNGLLPWRAAVAALACLLCWDLGATAQAQNRVITGRTPGGLPFVHVALPDSPYHAIAFAIPDPAPLSGQAATAILAARLMLGGAGEMREATLIEAWRDQLTTPDFASQTTHFVGTLVVPATKLDDAARLLRLSVQEPSFAETVLDRVRRQSVDSARRSATSPSGTARRALVAALAGTGPAAGALIVEPPAFEAVTRADLLAWRQRTLAKGEITIASAGPVPMAEVGPALDLVFGGLPVEAKARPVVAAPLPPRPMLIVVEQPVAQSAIVAGLPVTAPRGLTRLQVQIGLQALGGGSPSRLFAALRERLGASYGSSAQFLPIAGDEGLALVESSVANDKVVPAVAAVRQEIEALKGQGIAPREIEAIKTGRLAAIRQSADQPGPIAGALRDIIGVGLSVSDFEQAEARIGGLTAEQVSKTVAERLASGWTIVVVTPSAAGLQADCVVRTIAAVRDCR